MKLQLTDETDIIPDFEKAWKNRGELNRGEFINYKGELTKMIDLPLGCL